MSEDEVLFACEQGLVIVWKRMKDEMTVKMKANRIAYENGLSNNQTIGGHWRWWGYIGC